MNRLTLSALSLFALALSTNLHAEEAKLHKWYGGVAVGGGDSDLELGDFNDGSLVSGGVTTEEFASEFFIGYPLTFKNLPFKVLVEGGYLGLPNTKFDGVTDQTGSFWGNLTPTGTPGAPMDVTARGKVDGLTAAGILDYPVWQGFHVQGKLGFFFWDSDTTFTNVTVTNSLLGGEQFLENVTQSDDGLDIFFGLGAEYNFLKRFAVRLEYERYAISFKFAGDTNYDILSAAFIARF